LRYSLHEIDKRQIVATTVAADRDEASLLDEWGDGLLANTANPTIPVFVVSSMAAHPQASQGAGCGDRYLGLFSTQ
jgi:hypothetical protein